MADPNVQQNVRQDIISFPLKHGDVFRKGGEVDLACTKPGCDCGQVFHITWTYHEVGDSYTVGYAGQHELQQQDIVRMLNMYFVDGTGAPADLLESDAPLKPRRKKVTRIG